MRRALTISTVLLVAVAAFAQKDLPSGWHKPTAAELGSRGDKDLSFQADFDGDGKPDTAYILADDRGRAAGVLAFMSSISRWTKGDSYKVAELQKWSLTELAPGEYKTACGKNVGDYDCSKDVGESIKLDHPGIQLSVKDGPTLAFFWDAQSETLKRALLAN